jgi:RNA polymerase sigma factor (sigma-70 family)
MTGAPIGARGPQETRKSGIYLFMTPLVAQRPRVDRSFERLYQRHVSDVYHYALAVMRNPADAEDVTQTTFLNAYGAYRRGERPAAPRNWLIAIAHNVCRQRFRQSARRPQEVAFDEDVGEALVQDDDGPSAQDIRTALGHLAFNQRAALVMRELEGRSYAEIGEILGLTVSAVETLIFRARRALREQLEGSLTCRQAELALSRQMDGRLPRSERGALRAHLRACSECASFARSQRAQRAALRSIAAIPVPGSLASFFGGGAAAGAGAAAKVAAVVAVGAVVTGVGYEGVQRLPVSAGRATAVEAKTIANSAPASVLPARLGDVGAGTRRAPPVRAATRRERAAARAVARGGKAVKRRGDQKATTLVKTRARGRPAVPPGRTKARTTEGRGHSKAKPQRASAASRTNSRKKPGKSGLTKPAENGRPGKSDSPGQKSSLPVSPPALSTPTLSPPALPKPGKVKK